MVAQTPGCRARRSLRRRPGTKCLGQRHPQRPVSAYADVISIGMRTDSIRYDRAIIGSLPRRQLLLLGQGQARFLSIRIDDLIKSRQMAALS